MPFPALFKIADRRSPRALAALTSIITFCVYLPTLRNGFVDWDDYAYIVNNPHLRSLNWTNLKWLFSDASIDYWHPLSMLSHALDYALWGANPAGHHLTSIVLHAANTYIVVCLIAQLLAAAAESSELRPGTGRHISRGHVLPTSGIMITAAATGLLFGLHPLHVESVAWATERKDLLCGLFFLLSIVTYTGYVDARERPGRRAGTYYAATIAFTVLALASKAMAVTLPAVFLLLDWFPFRRMRSWRQLTSVLAEKVPFLIISMIVAILTFSAHSALRFVVPYARIPLTDRLLVAFRSLGTYLWKMVVPLDLVPYYTYPIGISAASFEYLAAMVLVSATTGLCVLLARKHPLPLTLWAYYVITLLPVLGIVQVSSYSMADRFTYLPSLGPFFAIGLTAAWVWHRTTRFGRGDTFARHMASAAAIVLIAALCYLTVRQIAVWRDSITLWTSAIERSHDPVPLAYLRRGVAFAEKGQRERALEDISRAIDLEPAVADGYRERGILFGEMGQYDRAVADLDLAIMLDPSDANSYNNRAIALEYRGELDRCLADYDRAIALRPGESSFYRNRGIALGKAQRTSEAINDLTRSISLNADAGTYLSRGNLYQQSHQAALAERDYRTACSLGSQQGCDALAAGVR